MEANENCLVLQLQKKKKKKKRKKKREKRRSTHYYLLPVIPLLSSSSIFNFRLTLNNLIKLATCILMLFLFLSKMIKSTIDAHNLIIIIFILSLE